jgi:hypothetical protein
MITERRPDVSPFSAIVSIANWLSGTSFPNHYVRVSNGGFAKGSPERSPSENGPAAACRPLRLQVVRCGRAIEIYGSSVLVRDFGIGSQPNMRELA